MLFDLYRFRPAAYLHKHYSKDHLAEVKRQMLTLGAPKIKAVWMDCYDMWAALEGCHRLRAAAELGLTPEIIPYNYDDVADLPLNDPSLGLDFNNPGETVSWLIDDCHRAVILDFPEA